MPLTASKEAAKSIQRRARRVCEDIRAEWTRREHQRRRQEAFQMQGRLASVLGLRQPEPAPVRVPR